MLPGVIGQEGSRWLWGFRLAAKAAPHLVALFVMMLVAVIAEQSVFFFALGINIGE